MIPEIDNIEVVEGRNVIVHFTRGLARLALMLKGGLYFCSKFCRIFIPATTRNPLIKEFVGQFTGCFNVDAACQYLACISVDGITDEHRWMFTTPIRGCPYRGKAKRKKAWQLKQEYKRLTGYDKPVEEIRQELKESKGWLSITLHAYSKRD